MFRNVILKNLKSGDTAFVKGYGSDDCVCHLDVMEVSKDGEDYFQVPEMSEVNMLKIEVQRLTAKHKLIFKFVHEIGCFDQLKIDPIITINRDPKQQEVIDGT